MTCSPVRSREPPSQRLIRSEIVVQGAAEYAAGYLIDRLMLRLPNAAVCTLAHTRLRRRRSNILYVAPYAGDLRRCTRRLASPFNDGEMDAQLRNSCAGLSEEEQRIEVVSESCDVSSVYEMRLPQSRCRLTRSELLPTMETALHNCWRVTPKVRHQ